MLPLRNSKITSEYGINRNGKIHTGLDLISGSGDRQVRAIAGGVVSVVAFDRYGYGNYVSIKQPDGYKTLYCHLESTSVKVGQAIKEGDLIGIEGTTGNSTGVHLHLEMRKAPYAKGDHIDVAKYLLIKNQKGAVVMEELTKEEKINLIKEKVGYDDNTCKYIFDFYKYGNEALDKLVKTLQS